MPQTCTVCRHPQLPQIDAALVARTPYRNLGKQYGLSAAALVRHAATHLLDTLIKAKETAEAARADDLLGQVRGLQGKAMEILTATELADPRVALGAIREARECIRLLGELAGKLQAQASVNFIISPEWRTVQTLILTALEPFPDARLAVARSLSQLAEAPVAGHA